MLGEVQIVSEMLQNSKTFHQILGYSWHFWELQK